MRFFKTGDEKVYDRVQRRLSRISRPHRVTWANSGVYVIQASLEAYERTADRAALIEARSATIGLLASIDTLLDTKR